MLSLVLANLSRARPAFLTRLPLSAFLLASLALLGSHMAKSYAIRVVTGPQYQGGASLPPPPSPASTDTGRQLTRSQTLWSR